MQEEQLIVLAFNDPDDTEKISKFLSTRGLKTLIAKDGTEAMELSLEKIPSMILADLELDGTDGQALLKALRGNASTEKIPFILFSETAKDIYGFKVEADRFLTRPFNLEELYANIRRSLLFSGGGETIESKKEISGQLSQVSLVDILQMLHFNQKEGKLNIISGEDKATIVMKGGQVFNAFIGEIESEKALYRIFTWPDGDFEFTQSTVTIPQKIDTPTGNLLMEGMRQLDEFEKGKRRFPHVDKHLKLTVEQSSLPKGLKPLIYEIITLLDYHPRVGELVDRCHSTDLDTYEAIRGLIDKKILEVTEDVQSEINYADFITAIEAIKVKESALDNWHDMRNIDAGKIFLVSTKDSLIENFIHECSELPDFTVKNSGLAQLGEMCRLSLYGDMDIAIFYVPTAVELTPLITALSSNLIGIVLLWDQATGAALELTLDDIHEEEQDPEGGGNQEDDGVEVEGEKPEWGVGDKKSDESDEWSEAGAEMNVGGSVLISEDGNLPTSNEGSSRALGLKDLKRGALEDVAHLRDEVLRRRKVPVVYVHKGESPSVDDSRILSINEDEAIFNLDGENKISAPDTIKLLLDKITVFKGPKIKTPDI
ncbi:MAG: DUF4388 domain-containing protein [Deltaproteobacteria bacterium]|nr:DUF4388 domain-containing protein [Deltaproteobacteria bacterium]